MTDKLPAYDETSIGNRHKWFGFLTTQNAQSIADAITEMFDGKSFTWVSTHLDPHRPEVRTGQRFDVKRPGQPAVTVDTEPLDDGTPRAYINIGDSYGSWGMSTLVTSQQEANALPDDSSRLTYIVIERGKSIYVRFIAGNGELVSRTAAVENDDDVWQLRSAVGGKDEDGLSTLIHRAYKLREDADKAHDALDELGVPRKSGSSVLTLKARVEALRADSITAEWIERDRAAAAAGTVRAEGGDEG